MTYDVCIIGSGAGGALAAYGLQKAGLRTAILEKGVHASKNLDAITVLTKYYRDQGMVGTLGNSFIGLPTGEVVGGTTKINSGTCFDTPEPIVNTWQKNLGINLEYQELTPYFKILNELFHVEAVQKEYISRPNQLFAQGLEKLGFNNHFPLKRNAKLCTGSGKCCFICPKEAKQSTDVAILPQYLKEGGILHTGTEVIQIIEKKDRVVLECKQGQKKKINFSCKNLIISAGSLSSPILIRKNKIGNAWRKAGNQLSIHPAVKVFAHFNEKVRGWVGVPQAIGFKHPDYPDLSFEGVFTPSQLACNFLPTEGKTLDSWFDTYENVATFGVLCKDSSRGKVRVWPGLGLMIQYDLNQKDLKNLIEAARFMGLTYLAAGATKVLLPIVGVQNEFSDSETLKTFDFSNVKPSQIYSMGFHPLGTCGIKRVVDENLNVYGSERIFVADGSVIPSSLGVNPQITIMSFALRLADRLSSHPPA